MCIRDRLNISSADRGLAGGIGIQIVGSDIFVELNSNSANASTAAALVTVLNARANHLVRATVTNGFGGTDIASVNSVFTTMVLAGQGSSFETATNLGELGVQSQIISSAIEPQSYGLELPGAIREPGHRDINEQHFTATPLRDPSLIHI